LQWDKPHCSMNAINFMMLIILSLAYFHVKAQPHNQQIIYTQKVTRDDRMFEKTFSNKRGTLTLTNDSLIFKCKKEKLADFNFSIPYSDIRTIKAFYGFLYPNRIKIRTKHGEAYRLFTYKKKSILRITREKIENK
jgi:GRAM domain